MPRMAAVLAGICLAAGAALAQDSAGMAMTVLNHVNMAREATASHDAEAALDQTGQALTLARQILLESAGQPQPVVVTISKDLETTTTYRPVKRLKHGEFTADRMKHDTSVREVEATGTVEQLDVTNAAQRLAAAQAALQRRDWNTAGQALEEIQQSARTTRVDGSMPLLQARSNLELARSRILEDKPRDAAAPLRAAAQALAEFARQAPGPDAENAGFMRQQMLGQAEHAGRDPAETLDWISSWLDTLSRWDKKMTVQR